MAFKDIFLNSRIVIFFTDKDIYLWVNCNLVYSFIFEFSLTFMLNYTIYCIIHLNNQGAESQTGISLLEVILRKQ